MLWYTLWALANTRRFALQVIDEMLLQMYFNIVSTYKISVRHICRSSGNLISHCVILFCPIPYNGSILCQSKSWPELKIQYKWTCKGFLVFAYTRNAIVSLHTIHAQHSLLSFGFFIYHAFMQINKFAVQC